MASNGKREASWEISRNAQMSPAAELTNCPREPGPRSEHDLPQGLRYQSQGFRFVGSRKPLVLDSKTRVSEPRLFGPRCKNCRPGPEAMFGPGWRIPGRNANITTRDSKTTAPNPKTQSLEAQKQIPDEKQRCPDRPGHCSVEQDVRKRAGTIIMPFGLCVCLGFASSAARVCVIA